MELYHKKLVTLGRNLISLIALALNLDEDFFEKVGACRVFMRLLHYPVETSDIMNYGASAHPDYGMITILATDGVRGLQACSIKENDTSLINHADITWVDIAQSYDDWVAFFVDPNPDCIVECLQSCCSDTCPPKFPPIRSQDYLEERFRITYALKG
ncbi:hypothetical protein MRB53_007192 [Persea americana]|uniref:Uncharacterized protein n=1 Tax=Persea americana TaxID=3435 RepID=A0ACC2MIB0_PERAE|nr:hypothetical protein MRB53_007192 [Persea americana]